MIDAADAVAGHENEKQIYSAGDYSSKSYHEQCLARNTDGTYTNGFCQFFPEKTWCEFAPTIDAEEKTVRPLDKALWPLPVMNCGSCTCQANPLAVFSLVLDYIQTHLELPDKRHYPILASWAMATWIKEKFEAVPYVLFIGPPNSGKTRALEVLSQLSYRALLSPSFTESALFRLIQKYGITLFFDESEKCSYEQRGDIVAVLNAGYRRGSYVYRVNTEKDNDVEPFDVFGFKGLASTRLTIPTLESRGIPFYMRRNQNKLPYFLDKEFPKSLRFLLLQYRFMVLSGNLHIEEDEQKILNFLPDLDGRLAELFYPLIAVSPDDVKKIIADYARELYAEKIDSDLVSDEAELAAAVLSCADKVENGKLAVEHVTAKMNEGRSEKQQCDTRSVGRWLKKAGFKQCRLGGGKRAVRYDDGLISYLTSRYGRDTSKETSQTSLTSPPDSIPTMESDVGDKSDVSPVTGRAGFQDLLSVYWKENGFAKIVCGVCGYEKESCWLATTHKGVQISICEDCAQKFAREQQQ